MQFRKIAQLFKQRDYQLLLNIMSRTTGDELHHWPLEPLKQLTAFDDDKIYSMMRYLAEVGVISRLKANDVPIERQEEKGFYLPISSTGYDRTHCTVYRLQYTEFYYELYDPLSEAEYLIEITDDSHDDPNNGLMNLISRTGTINFLEMVDKELVYLKQIKKRLHNQKMLCSNNDELKDLQNYDILEIQYDKYRSLMFRFKIGSIRIRINPIKMEYELYHPTDRSGRYRFQQGIIAPPY